MEYNIKHRYMDYYVEMIYCTYVLSINKMSLADVCASSHLYIKKSNSTVYLNLIHYPSCFFTLSNHLCIERKLLKDLDIKPLFRNPIKRLLWNIM